MVDGESNTSGRRSVPVTLATGRRPRSDAERNRQLVLAAARDLVAEGGIKAMTMDALAERAGVGKGTLYRGFGSRAGLAEALLDDAERRLQERLLTGPPPLGWGAPPGERLVAFARAYLDLLAAHADLVVEVEQGARFHSGAYSGWHAHVAGLLRQLGHDEVDVRADLVLALLSADLYQHLRASRARRRRLEDVVAETIAAVYVE